MHNIYVYIVYIYMCVCIWISKVFLLKDTFDSTVDVFGSEWWGRVVHTKKETEKYDDLSHLVYKHFIQVLK